MKYKYIYPRLPAKYDFYFFRVGGSGLANCLFVFAKAIVISRDLNLQFISPTWLNFSIGPYKRKEKDKRHYTGLFDWSIFKEIKKVFILLIFNPRVLEVSGISDYFDKLKGNSELIRSSLYSILNHEKKSRLTTIEEDVIGIHIRLGDYPLNRRVDILWYAKVIEIIQNLDTQLKYRFLLFSDGSIEELYSILSYDRLTFVNGNSAIEDIWTLSQCKLIIGSDSTFSAWGSFLGQVPIVFNMRHFNSVLDNTESELVMGDDIKILIPFLKAKLFNEF